jgi:nucleoside-diphosphate-sugar epimerase
VHVDALPHGTYNLGTGTLVTPTDVAAAVLSVVPEAVVELGATRPDRNPRLQPLDLTRSRDVLGYTPRFDLIAGFRDLAEELAIR